MGKPGNRTRKVIQDKLVFKREKTESMVLVQGSLISISYSTLSETAVAYDSRSLSTTLPSFPQAQSPSQSQSRLADGAGPIRPSLQMMVCCLSTVDKGRVILLPWPRRNSNHGSNEHLPVSNLDHCTLPIAQQGPLPAKTGLNAFSMTGRVSAGTSDGRIRTHGSQSGCRRCASLPARPPASCEEVDSRLCGNSRSLRQIGSCSSMFMSCPFANAFGFCIAVAWPSIRGLETTGLSASGFVERRPVFNSTDARDTGGRESSFSPRRSVPGKRCPSYLGICLVCAATQTTCDGHADSVTGVTACGCRWDTDV